MVSCFYCCEKTPQPNASWRGEDLFYLTGHNLPGEVKAGTQNRKLEAETAAVTVEERCSLACRWGLISLLFYAPRAARPGVAQPFTISH